MENIKIEVQKFGKDLVIIIPEDICEKLNIKEGTIMEMEAFRCGSSTGIRSKIAVENIDNIPS